MKGIIFDFGFTLFYFENPSVERYFECFKQGLVKAADILKDKRIFKDDSNVKRFMDLYHKKKNSFWKKSLKTKDEYTTGFIFKQVLEDLLDEEELSLLTQFTDENYDELADAYHFFEEKEWKPFPHTRETLEQLSKVEELKLAVLSNATHHGYIVRALKKYGLDSFFDVIITSAKYGKRKPDIGIFHYTLEKMGLEKNAECIICGDEYADIVGGHRAGLKTILCERIYKFPFEREISVPDLIKIKNISEILNIIQ